MTPISSTLLGAQPFRLPEVYLFATLGDIEPDFCTAAQAATDNPESTLVVLDEGPSGLCLELTRQVAWELEAEVLALRVLLLLGLTLGVIHYHCDFCSCHDLRSYMN